MPVMDMKPLRLALPATLAVTTFVVAAACKQSTDDDGHGEESSHQEYCEDIVGMSACDAEPGCGWLAEYDDCVNICYQIMDQQECTGIDRCEWETQAETDTGGGGYCHNPVA